MSALTWIAWWPLALIPVAIALVWWAQRRSIHPMPAPRRRAAAVLRALAAACALAVLAAPALSLIHI